MVERRSLVKARKGREGRGKEEKGRNNVKVEGEMEGVRTADEVKRRQMIPVITKAERGDIEVGLRRHGANETQKTDFNGRDLATDLLRLSGYLARTVDTLWMTFTFPRTIMITFLVVSMFLTPHTMTWCHHLPIYLHFPSILRAVIAIPTCITITLDLVLVLVIFQNRNSGQNHVHVAPRVPEACLFPQAPPHFHLVLLCLPICLPKWTNILKIATTLDWILHP